MKLYETLSDFLKNKKPESAIIPDWKPTLIPDQKGFMKKYLSGEVVFQSSMNFLHIYSKLFNNKELIELYKKKFPEQTRLQKGKKDLSFALILLFSSMEIKDLDIMFGKGLRPGDLGEGKARTWFFEDFGIKYQIFIDSRGSRIEIEKYDNNLMKNLFGWMINNPSDYYKEFLNQ